MNRKLHVRSAEGLSFGELIYLMAKKVRRKFRALNGKPRRYEWTFEAVIDATGPELLLRNYLEHRDLRGYLTYMRSNVVIKKAADIGCGFGRLEMLLSEFACEVVGFEREHSLVETARLLLPGFKFVQTEDLARLPCADAEFDFVLIFTVLQHLTDSKAQAVINEAKRITAPGGSILLCEQTDESDMLGDTANESALLMQGRNISVYTLWMEPLKLVKMSKRVVEPTYVRQKVGSYLLFSNSLNRSDYE